MDSEPMATREQMSEAIGQVADVLRGSREQLAESAFSSGLQLHTSHLGQHQGLKFARAALRGDIGAVDVEVTNVVVRADAEAAVASAYLVATVHPKDDADGESALFVGALVLAWSRVGSAALVDELRLQLNSVEGDLQLLPGWTLPVADRQWKPGDTMAALSSEMDSPWSRVPRDALASTPQQRIAQAWFRYAWGLDQADFALLRYAFAPQARATLPPMGVLTGRRALVSTLKAFRLPWPWMLHAGVPLDIQVDADGLQASLVLGRVIPGRVCLPDGRRIYGAHYRIRLVRDGDDWLIDTMDYLPGWVTEEATTTKD